MFLSWSRHDNEAILGVLQWTKVLHQVIQHLDDLNPGDSVAVSQIDLISEIGEVLLQYAHALADGKGKFAVAGNEIHSGDYGIRARMTAVGGSRFSY